MLGFPSPQGRTGVDLFPDECRVVDVRVHAQEGVSGDVRVKSFALLTEGRMSATLSAELSRLREDQQFPPHAWVTIWGLRSDDAETARQIQPLVGAGYVVRSVCTPAMALTAVARRHGGRTPGAAAYVALETGAMCLTIVRDGVLLFSREIPWEFAASADVIVERLSDELRRSVLLARQSFRTVVERIVLCGGMPRLRALTSPIGSALNLPVETLDSLSGIDAENVPEPADTFRASVAALWPAIAIAAESSDRPSRIPVAAAALAGIVILAAWYFFTGTSPSDRTSEVTPAQRQVVPSPTPNVPREPTPRSDVQGARPADVIPEPRLVVGSILYSPRRRLAIVNGRIVRAGDRIGSSTILRIEPRTVIVQLPDGTQRTLRLR